MNEMALSMLGGMFGGHPVMIAQDALASFVDKIAAKISHFDDEELAKKRESFLARTSHKYRVDDAGVAHFEFIGMVIDQPNWILDAFDIDYVVPDHFSAAIREADARADVKSIRITADSPGGMVFGLQNAYEAVRDTKKPTVVVNRAMIASAALFALAGADHIVGDPASLTGSIGTMLQVNDYSKLFERIGIKVNVVSTGPLKGAGTPGTQVSERQLEARQRMVDELADQFIKAVAEGRRMTVEQVRELATGDIWVGASAVAAGLIDSVNSNPLAAAGVITKGISAMDTKQMAEVLAAHPDHAQLIAKNADASKDEVLALIAEADRKAEVEGLKAKVEAAEKALADAKSEHAEAIKGKDDELAAKAAEIATLTKERDDAKAEAQKIKNHVPKVDAGDDHGQSGGGLTATEEEIEAMNPVQRAQFFNKGGKMLAD